MKLSLYVSSSGYCSRRKAALLIKSGKVRVDNKTITEPWHSVGAGSSVTVEGRLLKREKGLYLIFNKPKGVTTTLHDKFAEKKIVDFIPKSIGRVYPVGRLDKLSRGLIILTNDGDLCYRLTHPKFEIEKEYVVSIKGRFDHHIYSKMKDGVESEGDILRVKSAVAKRTAPGEFIINLTICEGKKRHLRRLFESLALKVMDLKRVRIGSLRLGNLKEGAFRVMDKKEIEKLIRNEKKVCFQDDG